MSVNLKQAMKRARDLLNDPKSGVVRIGRCDMCEEQTFAVQGESSDGINAYGSCLGCGYRLTRTEVEVGALSRSLRGNVRQ